MSYLRLLAGLLAVAVCRPSWADELQPLREALTLHASFEESLDAEFSRGGKAATWQEGGKTVPAAPNGDVQLVPGGKFGSGLKFTRKSGFRPQYSGEKVLGYNDRDWDATVSVWMKLDPDRDLEPGYCDPVQIVGDDGRKGFIFLEWSKDHTPRHFRYAARPLFSIWNPNGVGWEEIPEEKRPMVKVERAPFSREEWTHAVFTIENFNSKEAKARGRLYLNGKPQGSIEGWDMTFGWDPDQVRLVLGAAYVGQMDDLAVFNRVLSDEEVRQLHQLPGGVKALHP